MSTHASSRAGLCVPASVGFPPTARLEEQLALLDRSVNDGSRPEEGAPLLSEMIRRRVYEDMGRRLVGGGGRPGMNPLLA